MGERRKFDAYMSIYATLYDNRNGRLYDISEALSNLSCTTNIQDQPGKASFDLVCPAIPPFYEGATVSIIEDNKPVFKGFIFTKKKTQIKDVINITAYDSLRYLKNKDSMVFEGLTSAEICSRVCKAAVLPHRIVDNSTHICTPRSNDNVAMYDMIKSALDDTTIKTGKWFIIRDNFGVIEHVNVMSLWSGIILGDKNSVISYSYESTIDKDVANQVKLYRDNAETGKRDIFIVNDTINGGNNIREWGILQYYEAVDDNLTLSQIEDRAMGILRLYNRTRKSLKLHCMGTFNVFAGCIIRGVMTDIEDTILDRFLLVTECTHNIKNGEHTMDITVEVIDL